MILVMLGTQNNSFERLLKKMDELIEKKIIDEKVIVQSGYTNYESNNMGLNVAFYSSDGKIVSSSLLSSTSIKIDGKNYFADIYTNQFFYSLKYIGE